MKILGNEIGTIKDLVTTTSLMVGAIWFLFNFNLNQTNRTNYLNVMIDVTTVGTQETDLGDLRYVNYTYSITNESERDVSIAAAIVRFWGHYVAASEFTPEERARIPTEAFASSDFIGQSDANRSMEYGISANLAGYRVSPGEAVTIESIQYLYNETPDGDLRSAESDAILVELNIYSVPRCDTYFIFFKSCHDYLASINKALNWRDCSENAFMIPANSAIRCVVIVQADIQKDGIVEHVELGINDSRISRYVSSVTVPNIR